MMKRFPECPECKTSMSPTLRREIFRCWRCKKRFRRVNRKWKEVKEMNWIKTEGGDYINLDKATFINIMPSFSGGKKEFAVSIHFVSGTSVALKKFETEKEAQNWLDNARYIKELRRCGLGD